MTDIAVLGSGAWGIALGNLLHENGHKVVFWDNSEDYVRMLTKERENKQGLPGVSIPRQIGITSDITTAAQADVLVSVSPAHLVRNVMRKLKKEMPRASTIVTATKGIEQQSLLRMSEVITEELYTPHYKPALVALSGPSHAEEVGRKLPSTVVCASNSMKAAQHTQQLFMARYFRVYTNNDVMGVELGGALKNVIALAAGICDGLGLGDNSKAALMTRGLAEISRLAVKMGAKRETLAGLSGIGDLITTCASRHSRNRHVGERLGKGRKLKSIVAEMVAVAEGVYTAKSTYQLQKKNKVEMPIAQEVYKVLFRNKNPRKALADLMGRSAKAEIW